MVDLKPSDGTAWKDIPLSEVTDYVAKCKGGQITKAKSTEFAGSHATDGVVSVMKFSPHWSNVETIDD